MTASPEDVDGRVEPGHGTRKRTREVLRGISMRDCRSALCAEKVFDD